MNIYEKWLEIMKSVEYLSKDDTISFGATKYKAISEEKVTSAIRPFLTKYGVLILPKLQTSKNKELIRTEKAINMLTEVHVTYRIQNVEDKEDFFEVESDGAGVDTQDKGIGKAMTYAYKYMLLRSLAIPTGEDPDKISSEELDAKLANKTNITEKILRDFIAEKAIETEKVLEVLKSYNIKKLNEIDPKIINIEHFKNKLLEGEN